VKMENQDQAKAGAATTDEFLTKKEVAARLKVTERTIERWQHDGYLPYLKISTVILFHWPETVAHLKAHFKVGRNGNVRPGIISTPHPNPLPDRTGEGIGAQRRDA